MSLHLIQVYKIHVQSMFRLVRLYRSIMEHMWLNFKPSELIQKKQFVNHSFCNKISVRVYQLWQASGTANELDADRSVVNNFASPMSNLNHTSADYDCDKELQWQLQIGSNSFPEYPWKSNAETYYQLKKALGSHGSAVPSISTRPFELVKAKFLIGVDTEKILEAGFTSLNTRAGDLMVLKG